MDPAQGTKKNYATCRKKLDPYAPGTKLSDIDAKWMKKFVRPLGYLELEKDTEVGFNPEDT